MNHQYQNLSIVSVVVAPSAADLKLVKRQEGGSVVENRRNPKNPLKDLDERVQNYREEAVTLGAPEAQH
jgi:hypothetical protein